MHLDDLQYCDDVHFLQNCYAFILDREPDPDGFVNHMQALASGRPRIEIVRGFVRSAEARKRGVKLRGLRSAIFWRRAGQAPVIGPLVRNWTKMRETSDVQAQIVKLQSLSERLILLAEQDAADIHIGSARSNGGTYETPASLSPRAKEIFLELRG